MQPADGNLALKGVLTLMLTCFQTATPAKIRQVRPLTSLDAPRCRMSQFPCQLTRRELVWQMGGGFTGVALAAQLQQDGFFQNLQAREVGVSPLTPRQTHFPAKAKACIFLMMNGAPSQVDKIGRAHV